MGLWAKAKSTDSNISVVSWGWKAAEFAFPAATGGMMIWAATYRDYIWVEHGFFGLLVVGFVAALIGSACLALAGVGFRAFRPAAIPREQNGEPGSNAIEPPKAKPVISSAMVLSPPTTSTLISPNRFYSREEKERIVDTMNFIQRGFTAGRDMRLEAKAVSATTGHNKELDKSIERIQAVYAEAENLNRDLDKVRNESHSYPVDFSVLLAAKPVYSDEFQRALYDYSNALTVYRHFVSDSGEHRGSLAKVLDAQKRHLSRADHLFGEWMDKCDEQIRSARRFLEK